MKLAELARQPVAPPVAPFTGAWIETSSSWGCFRWRRVAPFTGAWIETVAGAMMHGEKKSPPSRGRGLKPRRARRRPAGPCRPLHGGVE